MVFLLHSEGQIIILEILAPIILDINVSVMNSNKMAVIQSGIFAEVMKAISIAEGWRAEDENYALLHHKSVWNTYINLNNNYNCSSQ